MTSNLTIQTSFKFRISAHGSSHQVADVEFSVAASDMFEAIQRASAFARVHSLIPQRHNIRWRTASGNDTPNAFVYNGS